MPEHPSILSQFIDLLPRYEFQHISDSYQGDFSIKSFGSWAHLVCALSAYALQKRSLREIEAMLCEHGNDFKMICNTGHCPKSTLADSNKKRDYRIFESFAKLLMQRLVRKYGKPDLPEQITEAMGILDPVTIDLAIALFGEPARKPSNARGKVPVAPCPQYGVTAFNVFGNDSAEKWSSEVELGILPGACFVFDKDDIDFASLYEINSRGAYFFLKSKKRLPHATFKTDATPPGLGILKDQQIALTNKRLWEHYPKMLRRLTFRDSFEGPTITLLTNHFSLPAGTVAALYKSRWEIEQLLDWMDHLIGIGSLNRTSPNAMKIQVWVALIFWLNLWHLKKKYQPEESFEDLTVILRDHLFSRVSLASIFQSHSGQPADYNKT